MNKMYLYIGGGVAALAIIFIVMYIFRPTATVTPVTGTPDFGTSQDRPGSVPGTSSTDIPVVNNTPASANQNIFKVLDGPVAGAILLQMGHPTTTVARFVMADSGRVFDLPLDVPGAVPRVVSNTTIPGIVTVAWTAGTSAKGTRGDGVVAQYIDNGAIKTLHLSFPPATTTLTTQGAVTVKFYPDGIKSVAVSPDGKSVAYLLATASGSDGYRSAPDGAGVKKLFSLPLKQLLLSWPGVTSLLAQSPANASVPGVVFSINAQTGATEPLLYANGISATANAAFSKVIYQTAETGSRSSYVRDVKTGSNAALSFDPMPERCIWSGTSAIGMYCATPLTYVGANFLDLWHAGVATAVDSIFAFNTVTGVSTIVAAPGSQDGGEQANIASLAVSPDDHYLLYIRKGDRSLWAVRLTQ
ncbi:MAG: hypothetical protein V4474_02260 [Patescibacteria group bacterium]